MDFQVRHVPAGRTEVRTERLSAPDADTLRARLSTGGSVVLSIRSTGLRLQLPALPRAHFDVAWWCRELETLLRAGMTAVEAIETLAVAHDDPLRLQVHRTLLQRMRQGEALSAALRAAGVFPDVLVAGVAASERTSRLPDALAEYQGYHEVLHRLRRQAASAALYPAMVIGVGALVSLFLLLYVIPRFSRMYGDMPQQLSLATELVLGLSAFLQAYGGLFAVAVGVLGGGLLLWAGQGRGARAAGWLVDRFPPLARVAAQFRLAQLFQALALLIRGGYSLDEALRIAGSMRLGPRWTAALTEARRQIANGRSASAALSAAGLTDITSQRLLAVGERSGGFDRVLQVVAERHTQRFGTAVERATRIVEPLLLLLVAVFVGALVVMMYMPIFDMAGGLGGGQ